MLTEAALATKAGIYVASHVKPIFYGTTAVALALHGGSQGFNDARSRLIQTETTLAVDGGTQEVRSIFPLQDVSILGYETFVEGASAEVSKDVSVLGSPDIEVAAMRGMADFVTETALQLKGSDVEGVYNEATNEYHVEVDYGLLSQDTSVRIGSIRMSEDVRGLSFLSEIVATIAREVGADNVAFFGARASSDTMSALINAAILAGMRDVDSNCGPKIAPLAVPLMEHYLNEMYTPFAQGLRPDVTVDFEFVNVPDADDPASISPLQNTTYVQPALAEILDRADVVVDPGTSENSCDVAPEFKDMLNELESATSTTETN